MDATPELAAATSAQSWCWAYVSTTSIASKLDPPARPPLADLPAAEPQRIAGPGRNAALRVIDRAERIPRAGALREASARARLLHVFLHHEVQAAELSAWAVLAFPAAPLAFREGLLRVLDDEVRHARLYAQRVETLGSRYGAHAVRDWFWQRIQAVDTPLQYTALMGLGFEGGNLEHAGRFERLLREAGDAESADIVGQVGREEVAHVRFAARWFTEWTGADPNEGPDFERWRRELPSPLTPAVLRGTPLDRQRRSRAGLSDAFLDELERHAPATTTRPRR